MTLLTVAHRLQTIMDSDKIVSLEVFLGVPYTDSIRRTRWFSMPDVL